MKYSKLENNRLLGLSKTLSFQTANLARIVTQLHESAIKKVKSIEQIDGEKLINLEDIKLKGMNKILKQEEILKNLQKPLLNERLCDEEIEEVSYESSSSQYTYSQQDISKELSEYKPMHRLSMVQEQSSTTLNLDKSFLENNAKLQALTIKMQNQNDSSLTLDYQSPKNFSKAQEISNEPSTVMLHQVFQDANSIANAMIPNTQERVSATTNAKTSQATTKNSIFSNLKVSPIFGNIQNQKKSHLHSRQSMEMLEDLIAGSQEKQNVPKSAQQRRLMFQQKSPSKRPSFKYGDSSSDDSETEKKKILKRRRSMSKKKLNSSDNIGQIRPISPNKSKQEQTEIIRRQISSILQKFQYDQPRQVKLEEIGEEANEEEYKSYKS